MWFERESDCDNQAIKNVISVVLNLLGDPILVIIWFYPFLLGVMFKISLCGIVCDMGQVGSLYGLFWDSNRWVWVAAWWTRFSRWGGVINVVFFSFLFMYAAKTWKKFDRWSSFLISSFVVLCEDELWHQENVCSHLAWRVSNLSNCGVVYSDGSCSIFPIVRYGATLNMRIYRWCSYTVIIASYQ